jgi:hypothetical protein
MFTDPLPSDGSMRHNIIRPRCRTLFQGAEQQKKIGCSGGHSNIMFGEFCNQLFTFQFACQQSMPSNLYLNPDFINSLHGEDLTDASYMIYFTFFGDIRHKRKPETLS